MGLIGSGSVGVPHVLVNCDVNKFHEPFGVTSECEYERKPCNERSYDTTSEAHHLQCYPHAVNHIFVSSPSLTIRIDIVNIVNIRLIVA